jgi:hypothetical protein
MRGYLDARLEQSCVPTLKITSRRNDRYTEINIVVTVALPITVVAS